MFIACLICGYHRLQLCALGICGLGIVAVIWQHILHEEEKQDGNQDGFDVRVVKGFGTRPYSDVRISVITRRAQPPVEGFFDYSARFAYKWRSNFLHSTLATANPGGFQEYNLGATNLSVWLPAQGAGVAGVLIADPCVINPNVRNIIPCQHGSKYDTWERTPALLNAFVGCNDTDFWGILGDNFYDQSGDNTWDVFAKISSAVKAKFFVTVAGNHDYWVLGDPVLGTTADQCANGHMQYYAQDTKAAESVVRGSAAAPFDLSVDPDADRPLGVIGCNLPAISNAFWYHQIGNVGLVGQSGAYHLQEARPFMNEACSWAASQADLDLLVLLGHWDEAGLTGVEEDMTMEEWTDEMASVPGCDQFHARNALKFVVGHTHCNDPHPRGATLGFRVAGFGMFPGCGNYGIPILDTTGERLRYWYFDTSTDDLYRDVLGCVQSQGWRSCTDHATLWIDQPFPARTTPPP